MAQSQLLLDLFRMQWDEAPTVWIDTETTGTRVGFDRCVQVAVVRFDHGELGDSFSALINPGMPIPAEVTEIHGITDDMVKDAISIGDFFAHPQTIKLLDGAQPGAYNGPFDKHFVPPFGPDWTWPWLDGLTLVRKEDRYAKGAGRHKLAAACERHGVELRGVGALLRLAESATAATRGGVAMSKASAKAQKKLRDARKAVERAEKARRDAFRKAVAELFNEFGMYLIADGDLSAHLKIEVMSEGHKYTITELPE